MGRSYDQFCPAARALDVIGGRWTLLIVRELLLGPRRYTDLVAGLPGIGPNVLAERLRELGEAGILSRSRLPPPAASAVYELTGLGEAMRPVVDELTRWGLRFLGAPRPGERFQLGWLLGCVRAGFRPELARGLHETYEFRVDGDVFHLRVDDGTLDVRHGSAAEAACVVSTDLATFMAVGARLLTVEDALERRIAQLEGGLDAVGRAVTILGAHLEATNGRYGIIGAVGAGFRPEAARGIRETYEFRVGDFLFHARVDDGTVEMGQGPAPGPGPAAALITDLATLLQLGAGTLALEDAFADGSATPEGDPGAGLRMATAFGVVLGR
ncbi:winged helix-turn-helix transcriptional regulator [Streptomyces hiroshimensis]|uniref:winged helix-turn-helix transcriptional regulator n=1 Tax=Streptomyces hiroshimensis TaxID=66424 RepID=UPI001E628D1F|nr:winged helix-turn-helix transcriptional regulator [Streptomyces hiroshimensis]